VTEVSASSGSVPRVGIEQHRVRANDNDVVYLACGAAPPQPTLYLHGAGHFLHLEPPHTINRLIIELIAS